MGKKARVLLISMTTVCLCLALLVCATYALFSDQVKVNNHLEAGSLEIGLVWTGYQKCELNAQGVLEVSEKQTMNTDLIDYSGKLFDVGGAVPNSWYAAEIRVSNEGSIAFDYGVRMLWNEDNMATDLQKELAGQIRITVTLGGGDTPAAEFMLSECAKNDVDLGSIYAEGEAQTLTVKAEFVDTADNNAAQGADLQFDLQVYAVQRTAE